MTLEQLRIFVAAAQYGSFTVAAEKLGITQSAVSLSIKKLEERHDVVLFDRSGRRLVATEAGQVLLTEAERILCDVDLTIRRVESRKEGAGRYPIMACTPNAYDHWVPGLIARVGGLEMPRVDLLRGTAEEISAWVMRGTADVGITEILPSHPQFRRLGVFRDEIILCATPRLAAKLPPAASWAALPELGPMIWEQSDVGRLIQDGLAQHQIDPRRLLHAHVRLSSTGAVLSMALSGRYPVFLPRSVASFALASMGLEQIGRLSLPLTYWMFALREREIEALASLVSKAAQLSPA